MDRKNCKNCRQEIPRHLEGRNFCSRKCRKAFEQKHKFKGSKKKAAVPSGGGFDCDGNTVFYDFERT